jgi:putative component of toxin-antitoxin plasmid stabilization module
VFEIRKTDHFAKWIDSLHDIRARARILFLLAGGDKSTQDRDIKTALRLSRNL